MERKPYFLYAALTVPALWIAYIILALVLGALSPGRSNGDLGNWGKAMMIVLGLLFASDVVVFLWLDESDSVDLDFCASECMPSLWSWQFSLRRCSSAPQKGSRL